MPRVPIRADRGHLELRVPRVLLLVCCQASSKEQRTNTHGLDASEGCQEMSDSQGNENGARLRFPAAVQLTLGLCSSARSRT
jgi:hypothetical protein